MNLFRLDASIFPTTSTSAELASLVGPSGLPHTPAPP